MAAQPGTQPQLVQQAYKYALRTTPRQSSHLATAAAAARFIYNWGLDQVAAARENGQPIPDHFALCKMWTQWKKDPANIADMGGSEWITERTPTCTHQAALRNAHVAVQNFFKSATGARAGRRMGWPRYKSFRHSRRSFQVHGSLTIVDARRIAIPVIGHIPTYESVAKLKKMTTGTVTCPQCHGNGNCTGCHVPRCQPDHPIIGRAKSCSACHAAATITCTVCHGNGHCPHCDNTGTRTTGKPCRNCPGHCRKCKGTTRITCPTCKGATHCGTCKGAGTIPHVRLVRAIVSQEADGQWYISYTVERVKDIRITPTRHQRDGGKIGIDLGTHQHTISNGTTLTPPHPLNTEMRRLRRAAQDLSRCQPGSHRYQQRKHRLAKIHRRIVNLRHDWTSKSVTELLRHHTDIVVEGYDVQEMMRSKPTDTTPKRVRRNRNRAAADTSIGEFRDVLTLRAGWHGTTITKTEKNAPTGRTCSRCLRHRDTPVPPHTDTFTCPHCGYTGDRRMNTATTLSRYTSNTATTVAVSGTDTQNARRVPVRPDTPRGARHETLKREAPTRRPQTPAEAGKPATAESAGRDKRRTSGPKGPDAPTLFLEDTRELHSGQALRKRRTACSVREGSSLTRHNHWRAGHLVDSVRARKAAATCTTVGAVRVRAAGSNTTKSH